LVNLFAGFVPALMVQIFTAENMPSELAIVGAGIHILCSLVNPLYSFPGTLIYLGRDVNSVLGPLGVWATRAAIPLLLSPVCFLLLLANLTRMDLKSYRSQPGDYKDFGDARKDANVKKEELRCQEEDGSHEAARYQGLSHTYKVKVGRAVTETPAVRGISLGIKKGECFGLLGPNGAGKTSTLAVLTGEIRPPTRGKVSIHGHDMSTPQGLIQAYEVLGVCPQIDPLWDGLSGRQHLFFYGRLKGVREAALPQTVDRLLHRLGIEREAGVRPASTYSGGMRRKLSLGIALIGHSPMMFLDEPSAAVDAGAKRHLWKVLRRRGPDQTVVLTTHSMEEAEALCDRIAIQVKGQLRCLGTPTEIKRAYGTGYQLELFVQSAAAGGPREPRRELLAFLKEKVASGAELLESHANRHLFQLPPVSEARSATLGQIFTQLQKHTDALRITDFSVTQPSLEQVFLRFAREQEEEEEEGNDSRTASGARSSIELLPMQGQAAAAPA